MAINLRVVPITILGSGRIEKRSRYKRSRQRERILELLQSTGGHPTADWIYRQLKEEFPNLSLGTVYRNLSILLEQDLICKIDFGSTFDRFDANIGPHYHFICRRCGSIVDLELPIDESLNERVNRATPFTAEQHRIEFFGVCDRCRRSD
jgi:Fur family peroxide stress response transcriptional regulator